MDFTDTPAGLLANIFNEIPVIVIVFSMTGNVLLYNNAAGEACGRQLLDLTYHEIFNNEHRTTADGARRLKYECWLGNRCYSIIDFYSDYDESSRARFLVGNDVTDIKNYLMSYNNPSIVDPMTGIFNRKVGMDYLDEMIHQIKMDDNFFSLAFLDLDNLKYINDVLGHAKGDKYILAVCDVIKASIRKSDVFSRMGGDEFLIIFPQCSAEVAERIMENVVNKLEDINKSHPPNIKYQISYGIQEVNSSSHILDSQHILNLVDIKMYLMKAQHREAKQAVQ